MKVLVLLCLFSVAFGAPSKHDVSTRAISDSLLQVLESLRQTILNGNEENGIPILDPLIMETVAISLDIENTIGLDVKAGGIHMTGLGDFQVADIKLSLLPLGLKFDFTLPMTILKLDTYSLKGLLFGALPIYGDGQAHFEVGDFRFDGALNLKVQPDGLLIVTGLKLNLHVGSVQSQTTGLLGGGDIDNVINAIIADLAPQFFNTYSDLVAAKISDVVIEKANTLLDGMTLQDLLDLINGKS